jgi:hypothetical protein
LRDNRAEQQERGALLRGQGRGPKFNFGGSTLAFVQPDGSLWDCPSSLRIAQTPAARRATIKGADARVLFASPPPCADCGLFSVDCVNMWPLKEFSRFLPSKEAG